MSTKLPSVLAVLLATLHAVSAWTYYHGIGFGDGPNPQQTALFKAALQNPNATKSIPGVMIDNQEFTFHVKIVEYTPTGAKTNIKNPRVVNTAYSLTWSGQYSDINETMRHSQRLGASQDPRLCVTMAVGLFSAAATNNWDSGSNGTSSCESALGDKCYSGLSNQGFAWDVPCTFLPYIPSTCASPYPSGGWASESLLDLSPEEAKKQNLTYSQSHFTTPYTFGYWSSAIYEAGDDTAFQRESERLHMILLTGRTATPVCARVKDDQVSPGDPSTSASRRNTATGCFVVVMAFAAAMLML